MGLLNKLNKAITMRNELKGKVNPWTTNGRKHLNGAAKRTATRIRDLFGNGKKSKKLHDTTWPGFT